MFNKVSPRINVPEMERSILEYWGKHEVIDRALQEHSGNRFIFYEGPPTANGKPHIGHVLPRAMKDIIPRHRAMQGYYVPRKAGWDTHGLPVELEVEKQLGINGKPDIEKFGIIPFIEQCKQSVFRYKREWEDLTERIGFWVDLDNAYVTYDEGYIESVWWALRKIWDRGLLYKGHKVLPYCARCGCALSSHELAQGYADVEDPSVFVRFPLIDEDISLLVWTTTPWTLISNTAVAVSADDKYAVVYADGEKLILAEALVSTVLGDNVTIERLMTGSELVGKHYRPPYSFIELDRDAHFVVAADFVTLDDGTGIVHMAPAFGEDDMRVGLEHDLPVIQPVNPQGQFIDEVEPFKGLFVKDADKKIIADLQSRGLLLKEETITHSYPMCWRCDTPLLYYSRSAWFIRMTEVKDELIANNKTVNWLPEHTRDGRFGNFLDNLIDWCLSRERFWGTPLNIWSCQCGHHHCAGSVEELKSMARKLPEQFELHKPYIDEVVLECPDCSGDMHRVPEVIDCWFDSGAMPFAQYHYPFENKEVFERNFPADFICEAIDQTRGWFYSLLAISTLVFDSAPYRTVLVTEHGLDDQGVKMSKHKGNVLDPMAVINTQGADALRWFLYVSSPPWNSKRFSRDVIAELYSQTLGTLWNVYVFFVLYANIDKFDPHKQTDTAHSTLDRWILSRLDTTISKVNSLLESYDITPAAREIAAFVDDLSNWYVRRSRRRFWRSGMDADKAAAFSVLYQILVKTAHLLAPFTPFISEEIYKNLVLSIDPEALPSVHLSDFPTADTARINADLEQTMSVLREYVRLGRSARNRVNIRVRQPLSRIVLVGSNADLAAGSGDILLDELNIKQLETAVSLSEACDLELKLKFEVAGAKFGKLTPVIASALTKLDSSEATALGRQLISGQSIDLCLGDETVTLPPEAVIVNYVVGEKQVLETDGELAVIVDTVLTPELLREGMARELVNRIERMRKEADFDVEDRIITFYRASGLVSAAVEAHADYIVAETLTDQLVAVDHEDPPAEVFSRQLQIDGNEVWLGIKQVR